MAARLVDLYPIDARVEISFDGEKWLPATIVAHAHPAVWAQTEDERRWFVTHPHRIRPQADPPPAPDEAA